MVYIALPKAKLKNSYVKKKIKSLDSIQRPKTVIRKTNSKAFSLQIEWKEHEYMILAIDPGTTDLI